MRAAYELSVEGSSTRARAGVVSALEELSTVCEVGKPTPINTIRRGPEGNSVVGSLPLFA